ncbi:MbnP family copper-binding protein [Leptolyngbya sp. FACHB-17]|uniref:MbnP family copper-binding protein n=1 Tax=unclassified Leptolyngbya TaxID=2650499 RepID=UPI00167FF6F7|nr:MbnP family copper-binding protein [Leptolyngbya sp. FACHB-17]MBD2082936.1 metallo-mystery pair system four-Cys motif protein [Leptolyngbya sp. FACHB-17]
MRLRLSLFFGAIASLVSIPSATAQSSQPVSIQFRGLVGDQSFQCNSTYLLGTPSTSVAPADFRFYVSDVALIDAQGKAVPVTLTQDNRWQYQNVALIDFENKTGMCSNGTTETNDRIVGTIPKGNYKGIRFALGVSFKLNHEDATIAPSPLNLTSLWWNWRGGYKFARIDFALPMSGMKHDQPHSSNKQQGFNIHLGSTGCNATNNRQKPESCSNPNIATITFENFNPENSVIVADLKSLVEDSNLTKNQPDTGLGCMSDPKDGDCTAILTNFGLPQTGKSARQIFFRVAPRP